MPEYSLLALFQLAPAPKLLDLVDIRADRFNGFWENAPLLNLSPVTQACMIYHSHHNSNQSYLIYRLLFVRQDRLEEILQVSTLSQQAHCLTFNSLLNSASNRTRAALTHGSGHSYPDHAAGSPRLPSPPAAALTRTFSAVWRWQPAKQHYQDVSGNLNRLYQLYDKWY